MQTSIYKIKLKGALFAKLALSITALALAVFVFCSCDGGVEGDMGEESLVKMTASVSEVGEYIVVEVLESEYTFGTHWVITSEKTCFLDKRGREIRRGDIKSGDTVEILYNGQVMLSYPPKIVARKIMKL